MTEQGVLIAKNKTPAMRTWDILKRTNFDSLAVVEVNRFAGGYGHSEIVICWILDF